MRRRGSSPSVLIQVAALAALAVVASQVVAFVVVLTAPPPPPAGFSAAAAADAALGRPAETTDGRALTRRLSDRPGVARNSDDPVARLIAGTIARRVGVPVDAVRVSLRRDGPLNRRGIDGLVIRPSVEVVRQEADATRRAADAVVAAIRPLTVRRPDGSPAAPLPPAAVRDIQVIMAGTAPGAFSLLPERLTFQPFTASVRLPDGRWATVAPPRGLIDPWQARLLIALLISMVLLAPLVWLMARRLTRPIRVFAEAAQRLGADPDAAPLKPSGPAEVRTAIAAFNEMQASLHDHMRRRAQTVAAIAHDLRTPLTRLRFRAEQAPEAVRDRMAADVEEMDALIAQAMAYVRGERAPERRERFDLADLARACAHDFAETGAPVTVQGLAALPVDGDPAALRRAVANLIDNAVKFGGAAQVRAYAQDDRAVIAVADDGPGLPEAELEAVFEPFARGERSRSRQTGGVGLGLAVARQAARAAGGEVTLANRPEGGLVATLSIPLSHGERA